MDAMITVIVIIFIRIQTKAFFALPSRVLKMLAANIKEHNASQVYTEMFFTNGEKHMIKNIKCYHNYQNKSPAPPAHHKPSLHVGPCTNQTNKAIQ